ncbi:ADP-ribose pyrophosphatase YjhB, NUDIX family [Novosphingobium sp. B1]|nr:ADP-ribose pyrophosphatase YjhB, NUDIX family [Novosphingobium sp. B1]
MKAIHKRHASHHPHEAQAVICYRSVTGDWQASLLPETGPEHLLRMTIVTGCATVARMVPVLPAPLHRALLRLAHAARLWWWRRTGRTVTGCSVIAINAAGEVLLVRHSYHARQSWLLPGGGLARGEDVIATARRELIEETGCSLGDARHLGAITLGRNGWTNVIEIVSGVTSDDPIADGREIVEARFFPPGALPATASGPTRAMIERWTACQNGNSA